MRTIQINPQYESLRTFIEHIPAVMDTEGTYIYGGRRNLIKLFVAPDGTELNVKRFKKPNLLSGIVYSTAIRKPKGLRAFQYPQRLISLGIETPEAVAYIEDRNALGLIGHSWFVSVQCPYPHLLYELGDAPEGSYEQLAEALGQYAAQMHEKEVLHRDFSPGNVLWDYDNEGYHFSIVDINRLHFGPVSLSEGSKSFARLWGPKHFIELTVRSYARQRLFDEAECLRIVMAERIRFWTHYQKKRKMEFKLEL